MRGGGGGLDTLNFHLREEFFVDFQKGPDTKGRGVFCHITNLWIDKHSSFNMLTKNFSPKNVFFTVYPLHTKTACTALIWQKEASDKSDISRKRAKCVFHLH